MSDGVMTGEEATEYPVVVTLRFKTKAAKDYFMGGLSDGFGESICDLDWPYQNWTEAQNRSGEAFESCDSFNVSVFGADYEEVGGK